MSTQARRAEHPHWSSLLEHRFDPALPEPAEWDQALAHLDECPACRAAAVEIDPTLAFRRLPAVEIDAGEIEAMQRSVAVLRRNRQLLREEQGVEARQELQSRRRWWLPTAAALAVGMGLTLAGGGAFQTTPAVSDGRTAGSTLQAMPSDFRGFGNLDTVEDLQDFNDPVVEGVENPAARVYQFRSNPGIAEEETIAVAFVIDPTIDV